MAATQPIPPYEHIQTHQFPFPSGNHEKKNRTKETEQKPQDRGRQRTLAGAVELGRDEPVLNQFYWCDLDPVEGPHSGGG